MKRPSSLVPSDRDIVEITGIPGRALVSENVLQQALLFLLWDEVRNGHYQLSIILAADKEREYSAPASYQPS